MPTSHLRHTTLDGRVRQCLRQLGGRGSYVASTEGVDRTQARDTWAYWHSKGLPSGGVEHLEPRLGPARRDRFACRAVHGTAGGAEHGAG